jgi:hypothetical protein
LNNGGAPWFPSKAPRNRVSPSSPPTPFHFPQCDGTFALEKCRYCSSSKTAHTGWLLTRERGAPSSTSSVCCLPRITIASHSSTRLQSPASTDSLLTQPSPSFIRPRSNVHIADQCSQLTSSPSGRRADLASVMSDTHSEGGRPSVSAETLEFAFYGPKRAVKFNARQPSQCRDS